MPDPTPPSTAVFDLPAIARNFPPTAATMLLDTRLVDEPAASARVFRVYTPAPAHYHATCDEYLLVLSGRATLFLGDTTPFEVGPGKLVFFKRNTVHGNTEILEHPFVVFAVDTPPPRPQRCHLRQPSRRHPRHLHPKQSPLLSLLRMNLQYHFKTQPCIPFSAPCLIAHRKPS